MAYLCYVGLPSLACSSIVHLGKNPEVVSRLLKELDTCKSNGDDQTLSELSFLEKCWKEVARVCPPFGGGFRQVIKTFELEVSFSSSNLTSAIVFFYQGCSVDIKLINNYQFITNL